MNRLFCVAIILLLAVAKASSAAEIAYEKFTLPNGLRVIVHEDRKAPIVSVGMWYHVGSKDEPKGRTGFAHLFEHIMFRGSENFSGSYFDVLTEVGGSNLNGTTGFDRTNYYVTVPTPALERVLWLESDRMGFLLGAVTQKTLDDERNIVKNEKRQSEGKPYGLVNQYVEKALFPEGHPYHHLPIGSMADLEAASLEDVHGWFREYYGAANALVVLSGDIDVETAQALTMKYFGEIPAGPPLHRSVRDIPERTSNTFDRMQDRVPQTLVDRSWVIPPYDDREKIMLDVVTSVLNGKEGRLHKEIVEKLGLASEVSVMVEPREIASIFSLKASLKKGANLAALEDALDSVWADFLEEGPTKAELSKHRDYIDTVFLKELGSVHVKGSILAEGELYAGDPGFIHKDLDWTRNASAMDVKAAANKWLGDGYHQLIVEPFGNPRPVAQKLDRSKMPVVENSISIKLPEMQEAVLDNGLKLVLAERRETPVLHMALVFDNAGGVGERAGKMGASGALANAMSQAPKGKKNADFEREKIRLGASLTAASSPFSASLNASFLSKNLKQSVDLLAASLTTPAFDADELGKWREKVLLGLKQAKNNPGAIAGKLLSKALYGESHPLGENPNAEAEIAAITVQDMKDHYSTWIRSDNAVLYVTGDTDLDQLVPLLNRALRKWKAPSTDLRAAPAVATPEPTAKTRIIVVDRPGAPQTLILGGRVLPKQDGEARQALDAVGSILGSGMSSRLNSNLRVEKGWSYGASGGVGHFRDHQALQVYAPVQRNKTVQSLAEIIKEMKALTSSRPPRQEELDLYRKGKVLSLPAQLENSEAVLGSMLTSAFLGLPLDDLNGLGQRLEGLTPEGLMSTAEELLSPDGMIWVLVGDASVFKEALRQANLGGVEIWTGED